MDVGVALADTCAHKDPGTAESKDEFKSNLPVNSHDQDWIEGCYSKLNAVSRALDNHLLKSKHSSFEEMDVGEGYEYSDSRPESVGDPDNPALSTGGTGFGGGLTFMDYCKAECCHAHSGSDPIMNYNYEGDDFPNEPVVFDLKGKRFSSYLEDLRRDAEEDDERVDEKRSDSEFLSVVVPGPTRPSNFAVPDALGIMDKTLTKIMRNDPCACTSSEVDDTDALKGDRTELDLDSSLREYLESDNDIMSRPLYKRLCAAHISLCKLGATDAQLKEMEELSQELESKVPIGDEVIEPNPELDKFMNEYCDFLEMHKKEFAKPFDEAMEFCKVIDEELANSGLKFLRDKGSIEQSLTNDTIARLQQLPLGGEAFES